MTRCVILVCGPPGAGKSTYARTLAADRALTVYDIDDWPDPPAAFELALAALAGDPGARAVVIRSGATLAAREAARARIGATATIILKPPPAVCRDRVLARNRERPPIRQQLAAVGHWWRDHEPDPRPDAAKWTA
jgi:adenylate kinase family enzyme